MLSPADPQAVRIPDNHLSDGPLLEGVHGLAADAERFPDVANDSASAGAASPARGIAHWRQDSLGNLDNWSEKSPAGE